MKLKPEKNSGLNEIRTHDLCDTGAVLYQLSYQANWELATLRVRNIPLEDEEYKWIYESSYIWTAENDEKIWLIIAVLHTTRAVVRLKLGNNSGLNGIRTHDLYNAGAVLSIPTERSSQLETLRFWGNKCHCSPRDQSLSVKCLTTNQALRRMGLKHAYGTTGSGVFLTNFEIPGNVVKHFLE